MSKSNRQRRAAKRRSARRKHASQRQPAEPDLISEVQSALADPDPLHLLSYVSTLLAAIDPRSRHPFARPEPDTEIPTPDELAATFIDVATPETTALLAVLAALTGDDLLRARIRRELAARPDAEPQWLTRLPQTSVYRAVRMGHTLGDGDNIMLGVRIAGSYESTVLVYIDHHLGTLVKDAFVVSETLDDMVAEYRRVGDEDGSDFIWEELSLADARVWLDEAIEKAAITFPPLETDSWPACRPLTEWLTREFPLGGSGYQRPEWNSEDRARLTDRFFASDWGRRLDDADHRDLLESLLWYGTDYGPGDPLRWSPVKVEMLLGDWLLRKVVAPADYLAKAPELLRAFVRFAHAETGLDAELTEEAAAAIDVAEPEYLRAIRSPRPQGPAALLAALGIDDEELAGIPGFADTASMGELTLDHLAGHVGGRDQLDRLDTASLPDEPFQWADIPDDVSARVAEVLALTDRCCTELLDVEYRTATRRVLARVAAGDPAVFRRKARVETAAAALVWITGRANGLFEAGSGRLHISISAMMDHFGLGKGSVSQRAATMLRAGGFLDDTYTVQLGSADYLIADRRRWLIEERDYFQGLVDQDG